MVFNQKTSQEKEPRHRRSQVRLEEEERRVTTV